jgi:hypothetical protein
MSFGTIFQLVGAIVALALCFSGHPQGKDYAIGIFVGIHVTGDAIVGFLKPLFGLQQFEKDAQKFVKLRGFLFFVGWALMLVGHFSHVYWTLLFMHLTSNGFFLLGAMLAIVGAFTYDQMYT